MTTKKETTKKAVTKTTKEAPKSTTKKTPAKKIKKEIERTRIITAKITIIEKVDPEVLNEKTTKKVKMEMLSNMLKAALKNADDIKVTNVQDFIMGE